MRKCSSLTPDDIPLPRSLGRCAPAVRLRRADGAHSQGLVTTSHEFPERGGLTVTRQHEQQEATKPRLIRINSPTIQPLVNQINRAGKVLPNMLEAFPTEQSIKSNQSQTTPPVAVREITKKRCYLI